MSRIIILTTQGDVGTIVERHDLPGRETGYSVEFFDMLSHTVAVVTLSGQCFTCAYSVINMR